MAICKDPNDPTQRNADALLPLSDNGANVSITGGAGVAGGAVGVDGGALLSGFTTISSDGTLLPGFATAAFNEYSNLVAADIDTNSVNNTLISKYKRQYGQEAFDAGLDAINNNLVKKEIFQNNLSNYPQLQSRLNTQLPITQIEYVNYMNEFLQNPNTIIVFVDFNTPLIQSQLNDFYRNNFSQSAIGSFCALMPSVFGAIGSFFNLVENAQQVFQDLTDFINNASLKDFSLKFIMKKLIGQIKEQALKIVDSVVSKVKGVVENLSFENIVGQIETFVNQRIISQFISLRSRALAFFSEENIKNLKKKIENLINYAGSIFKDPSLEEIQFLVYRFCTFAGQVESAINLVKKPLDDFVRDYQDNFTTIKSWGRISTSEAVTNGGAIRISDADRKIRINNGIETEQRQPPDELGRPTAPPAGITSEEWSAAQAISTFAAAKADSRFLIPVGSNRSWALNPIGQTLEEGWEMLYEKGTRGEIVARLIRLQRLFGRRLTILSAYRSERMQAVVNPGVKGLHIQAKALDITWSGFSSQTALEFCRIAKRQAGFTGFGIYASSNFVHIDARERFLVFKDDFGFKEFI
jgi:hypothetical protein